MQADIREFRYPQTEHPVLENVTFTLEPGQMLGFAARPGPAKARFCRCSSAISM
ncbi:multidrug transporter membrane\ATP-binding components [Enterobacter cancerogenus]|uniref:Multidrug transporter membrane\ATP-binding components n=1 Tax=Enterobacter cancerogenus TaxID=69218 RepID=A0A484YY10_9ENTR|nr:multidrug transporter membrane\ATP-binding components [Enterobacter cancerogenus]